LAEKLYDGTSAYDYYSSSAYKIDEYNNYNSRADESRKKRKVESRKLRVVNLKKLSIALSILFVVASAFLYVNALLIETSTKVTELTSELEDLKVRNTQVSFDIVSGVDYSKVEEKALNVFGMQHPESYQNVYVDVVQSDYAEVANLKEEEAGFTESLISGLQSFLAYIR